jgi:hypothetical protein
MLFGGLSIFAVGCSIRTSDTASVPPPVTTIIVPPDKPPSPAGWPAYPTFSGHSCWTRRGNGVMRAAPSATPPKGAPRNSPAQIVRRLLDRLGDRRYIHGIQLGAPPPLTLQHLHGYFGGARPPADALWAFIDAPAARETFGGSPTPEQIGATMTASWEAELVMGSLRDDFCEAGGPPLVGSSIGNLVAGVSDNTFALEERFPNPSPRTFRRRVDLIGRRYGFRVDSLRLLRPRQLAPLLVVETSRDRKQFVGDIPAIASLLNPVASAVGQNASTFEGFMLEARDADGPFVRVNSVNRGEAAGGQWSWDRCVYPYGHSESVTAKPCP